MFFKRVDKNKLCNDLCNVLQPQSMQYSNICWKKAKNEFVWDLNGKKYIDFSSTIFVQNFGHSNSRVKKYLKKQINSNLLHSYLYNTVIKEEFLEKLIWKFNHILKSIQPSRAYLFSSGTEAIEATIRLMLLHGQNHNRNIILSFDGSMHGRTMGADLLKGTQSFYEHPNFTSLPFPDTKRNRNFMEDLEKNNIDINKIAGIVIEPYQGWSCEIFNRNYLKQIFEERKKEDFLVCIDEIQSGFFRTGELLCFSDGFGIIPLERYSPDLICLGKAIAGGFPLSAVIGNPNILNLPKEGELSSTHSANPLGCAAGLAIMDELKKFNYKNFWKSKKIFNECLNNIFINNRAIIKKINNLGMVAAVHFETKEIANFVYKFCLQKGLIVVKTGKETIKLAPPLTIKERNLKKGLNILKEVLEVL